MTYAGPTGATTGRWGPPPGAVDWDRFAADLFVVGYAGSLPFEFEEQDRVGALHRGQAFLAARLAKWRPRRDT
jgi:hypothetical protein